MVFEDSILDQRGIADDTREAILSTTMTYAEHVDI